MGDRRLMARGRVRRGAESGGRRAAAGRRLRYNGRGFVAGQFRGCPAILRMRQFRGQVGFVAGEFRGCPAILGMRQSCCRAGVWAVLSAWLRGKPGVTARRDAFGRRRRAIPGGAVRMLRRAVGVGVPRGVTGGGHRRPDGVCGRQRFVLGGSGGGPVLRAQAGVTLASSQCRGHKPAASGASRSNGRPDHRGETERLPAGRSEGAGRAETMRCQLMPVSGRAWPGLPGISAVKPTPSGKRPGVAGATRYQHGEADGVREGAGRRGCPSGGCESCGNGEGAGVAGAGWVGAAFAFLYQGTKAAEVAGPGRDSTLDSPCDVRGDAVDWGCQVRFCQAG